MKSRAHRRPLDVHKPNGEQIVMHVYPNGPTRILEVGYLEVVDQDAPPFAQNGVIRFNAPNDKYAESVTLVEKYIEQLYDKGKADEDVYTGLGAQPKRKRAKRKDTSREISLDRGRDSASVHSGSRRDEPTEDTGRGSDDTEVASSSDSSAGEEDKGGD